MSTVAYSSETGRTYHLEQLVGKGGFGEVYVATVQPPDGYPARVCVKVGTRLTSWLREAYFAELLAREPRALKVFDRFAEPDGAGGMRYCLVMDYAEHGDLGAWLKKKGPQSEKFVRREIAALLQPLNILHRGQAMHRDLTPFNVFVCANEELRLGDFGIATHQSSPRGVTAEAFNPFNAPTEIAWGWVRRWQQRDDVYQVGQIAAMLLRGDIQTPMRKGDIRRLPCSDQLKEIIHRCLGARGQRFESAAELIEALRKRPPAPTLHRVSNLKGLRVAFTGIMTRPRMDAIKAAKRAGASVQSKPGLTTDVLVRGRPNPLQIAGKDAGAKLIEVRRLAAQGHVVKVIGEGQFWKLARARATKR